MEERCLYEFGPFRMDTNEKCLFRGDSLVALTPKAFDTLLVLAKNRGRTVGKEELLKEVWDGAFVEEAVVAQNVFAIRRALGPEYIETVPKRGYRFVAEVTELHSENGDLSLEEETKAIIDSEESRSPEAQPSRSVERNAGFSSMVRHYQVALSILLSIVVVGALLLWTVRRSRTKE